MIPCAEAKRHLWDYYDGECPPSLREALTAHLAGCPACQMTLNQWIFLSQKAFPKKFPPPKVPPFLWTRVLASIEAAEQRQATGWWAEWRWMGRVASVVALLIVLSAGIIVYRAGEGGAPLEFLLRGEINAEKAIWLSREHSPTPEEVTAWVLGGPAWEEN
ncbi:MAG: zf-HC2 domain-containing protein [Elusimicrobia bacterium]|nr:zf-HC2 domain-containing protein [Elusimicrobiota bacterium]